MRLLLTLTLGIIAGCAEHDGDREWAGQFVTIIAPEQMDIEPCGGHVAFTDRVAKAAAASWAGEDAVALDAVIELRMFDEEQGVGAARVGGFAWAAKQRAYLHELGHLVTAATDGGSMPVFTEGLAEMIGNSGQSYVAAVPAVESFAFLDRPAFGTREYEAAAQLLAFLARRHGMAKVREAYRRADSGSSPEDVEDVFVAVFGDDIHDDFDELEANATCPYFLWECDVGPLAELPLNVQVDPQSCLVDPDVAGFTSASNDDWWPVYYGAFELPEPRTLGVSLVNAVFTRDVCSAACAPSGGAAPTAREWLSSESGVEQFRVQTFGGKHHLQIRPIDPQQPFSATVEDLGAFE